MTVAGDGLFSEGMIEAGRAYKKSLAGVPAWLRRVRRCQYGIPGLSECGVFATTKRKRPNRRGTWDVCDTHAEALDRLRANIDKHHDLLERLT